MLRQSNWMPPRKRKKTNKRREPARRQVREEEAQDHLEQRWPRKERPTVTSASQVMRSSGA